MSNYACMGAHLLCLCCVGRPCQAVVRGEQQLHQRAKHGGPACVRVCVRVCVNVCECVCVCTGGCVSASTK